MAKSDIDAAVAAENTQGRKSEGKGVSFTAPKPEKGKLVAKGSTAAADPTIQTPSVRANRPYAGQERLGARYGISASYAKPTAPEAGLTQANGRVVSPATIRQKDSWSEGMETSY